ncbi:MAG TPA: transposase [Fluviicoccus sp.]|nr:transposase [Fluviicoccus sp.]
MPDYRRAWHPGGTFFFTVNLLQRHQNDLLIRHIDLLRQSVKQVRERHPFTIHGWVVLPEHIHCLLELPSQDADYATRWRLIKGGFSRALPCTERRNEARQRRGERGIWQRRYWEHMIRDEDDFRAHMDYIHINPVKHGYVERVRDWPYSTFRHLVSDGLYSLDWGGGREDAVCAPD